MAFKIGASDIRLNPTGEAEYLKSAADAKDALQQMALSISSGTSVKSGYLSLSTAKGKSQQHELGLRRLGGANESTARATSLVKNLVAKAYGDQPAVQQALKTYLQKSDQRIGTQSFMRLVQSLEGAQGRAAGEQPSGDAARLGQIRVKSGARLSTDGFEASAGARREIDRARYVAQEALDSATSADPVAGLKKLMDQHAPLSAAIERADASAMNLDALKDSLRELNAKVADLQPRAAKVQALLTDAKQEVGRMADAELGGLRSARDQALRRLEAKVEELNRFSAAFHADPGANGPLDEAIRRHAQLASELDTAKADAQKASEQLNDRAQTCAQAWKQEWDPAVQAQPLGWFEKSRFGSAVDDLKSQATKDLAADGARIAQCTDRFGPPDAALADHLSNDRLSEAFTHLKGLKGDGAAACMADIARVRLPQGAAPGEVAQFAARAFGSDDSSGMAVALWMREAFNLQSGGSPARDQMREALGALGQLSPDLARATIIGLGSSGQRITSADQPIQPGSEFHCRPMNGSGLSAEPLMEYSLQGRDLQNAVGTIEGYRVELPGAQLAGAHLVFKPQGGLTDRGLIFNLSAAASLPAQVRIDFSDARTKYAERAKFYGEREFVCTLIANSGPMSESEQRQNGLLRMIERLPPGRSLLQNQRDKAH